MNALGLCNSGTMMVSDLCLPFTCLILSKYIAPGIQVINTHYYYYWTVLFTVLPGEKECIYTEPDAFGKLVGGVGGWG